MPCKARLQIQEGWGRHLTGRAWTCRVQEVEQIQELLAGDEIKSILPLGETRSYGDACLNSGRFTLDMTGLNHALEFDQETGVLTCEAGISLDEIIRITLPRGWFLPVTPGTRFPTLGGCFAADVHGKNHHHHGTISRYVHWIELLLADGSRVRCSASEKSDLFFATAGGMGWTGIITKLSLQLAPVESSYFFTEHVKVNSLRDLMDTLSSRDEDWPHAVAWVDCVASGQSLGRGEVILGRSATRDELPGELKNDVYKLSHGRQIPVPLVPPVSLVNPLTSRIFNEVYFHKTNGRVKRGFELYDSYFYPLDIAKKWNRLYGPPGFVQYQYIVPMEAGYSVIRATLQDSLREGHPSSLAVLKRMGEHTGLLSFPKPGWTLALDIPVRPGLMQLLKKLDERVLDHGGRIYLAKDARMSPDAFHRMYPEYPDWLEVKKQVDPEWRFSSDMARRLELNRV